MGYPSSAMVSAYEYPNLMNVSMAALLCSKLYMWSSHDLVLVQDHHRIPLVFSFTLPLTGASSPSSPRGWTATN